MKQVTVLVVGAGDRGFTYADYSRLHPEQLKIVGVAEPRDEYRSLFVKNFNIQEKYEFISWEDAASQEKFADFVIIATHERERLGPVKAFAEKGYHILLEKPMGRTPEECKIIYDTVKDKNLLLGLCFVLRYANFTSKLKEIIDSGTIGEIVSIQRLEPVGFWQYAHSYVRGNWKKEKDSTNVLVAKSSHDIDWISYIMGKKCISISSFGSLKYFKKENKPEGSANRCVDCKIESSCPYSAKKIYLNHLKNKNYKWPLHVVTLDFTEKGVLEALKTGPYGKCVYNCDNDVLDNQVVNMQFEGGGTASFVMNAFTAMPANGEGRRTTIFGTKGEIKGNDRSIEVYDFLTNKISCYDTFDGHDSTNGHGDADYGLMKNFIKAVEENNPKLILSNPEESLTSHLLTYEADRSRKENIVINL